jgi:glycosyltransferase involved in cell wall biosynthesis
MNVASNSRQGRPLRIALVDCVLEPDRPGRTGLSDIVWDMAAALVDLGHEPHVVASYTTHRYPDPRVTVHNFSPPPMAYRNIAGNLWRLKRVHAVLKAIGPDVVHAPDYLSTAVLASLGLRAPLVLTVPGNIYHRLEYGHSYEWHLVQVLKWAARVSARRCRAVIAVSTEMKQWWQATGSPPERTPCIPCGVDIGRFHPVPGARALTGLDPGRPLFLYAGRFAAEKGLFDLIRAVEWAQAAMRTHRALMVLVGDGPEAGRLVETVSARGLQDLIHIHGWLDQDGLTTWYSAADAFVLPSHSEGSSRTIAEAMACGTPVIGSAISGSTDHIIHGRNGYLFPAGDVRRLASLLASAAAGPAALRAMRPSCLNYVTSHLTWPYITARIVDEVYMPALGNGPGDRTAQTGP